MGKFRNTALAAALGVSTVIPAQAADMNIVYATFLGPNASLVKDGVVVFLDYVKEHSDGAIDYTLHSGGSLLSATGMLEGIRDGIADGGQILGVYNPAELPVTNVVMGLAPAMTSDPRAVAAALTEYILLECPRCIGEYEENNVQYIGSWATSRYAMLCAAPVNGLDSLKGRKVRASGEWAGIGAALGMTPVTMSLGDTYEALQRGQVDCTLGEINWMTNNSFGDVAKYGIELDQGISYIGPVFSLRKDMWDDLSDEHKQVFYEGTARGMINGAIQTVASNQDAKDMADEKGWVIAPPSDDIKEKLETVPPKVRAALISRSEQLGIENSEAIIDGFLAKLEKWDEIVAKTPDQDALVEQVMIEIYDKL
ncbi:C4-dicarboxylate TRAP transporter substrate-binding protein [Antarcticimicrobium sediminis]|uniref:TRAP-type C4-dicarboxylate transport system, substrate-binding protein n=1 Tax=Antarcticimicrobium sediminis TaxID=2546227 RepID=A0A4R5ELX0_9RHOB|nr:C4-dicarboxylate TRAP transporter substrate-binding protein [Antarcticimicrobium sediminis]TDE35669.1 hypothetical protein E1B25_17110 [Antarcticimicrobium sediminis]